MPEKKSPAMFDFYKNLFEPWADIYGSQDDKKSIFPIAFNKMESLFKPFTEAMEKTMEGKSSIMNFIDITKNMPTPSETINYMNDKGVLNSWISGIKLYDEWLKSMHDLVDKGFEIAQTLSRGEDVDIDDFADVFSNAYKDMAKSFVKSLEDTPFNKIKGMDEAIEKFLNSFFEEQETARTFFKQIYDFNCKMMVFSKSSKHGANKMLSDFISKGNLSSDSYKYIVDTYGNMMKNYMEIFKLPAVFMPEYKERIDNTTSLVEDNIIFFVSWMETNIELCEEINRLINDMYKSLEDSFKFELEETFKEQEKEEESSDVLKKASPPDISDKDTAKIKESTALDASKKVSAPDASKKVSAPDISNKDTAKIKESTASDASKKVSAPDINNKGTKRTTTMVELKTYVKEKTV
ncbi:hypothetical protein GMMP15_640016 [Candidatus Magnetomoraceae bacterium gMMP-15]